MSEHFFRTQHEGRPIQVLTATAGHFLVIEYLDADEMLYSNLHDPVIAAFGGLPRTMSYFLVLLQELGVSVPRSIIDAVQLDQLANAGNWQVEYDEHGVAARAT